MSIKKPKVVVVGSSNTDMVVRTSRLPGPGETVLGGEFAMVAGGKGANQAVAAARLGADVTFVACVGDDLFGESAIAGFNTEGIDTRFIRRDTSKTTGVALIGVDETRGENSIIVAPGANDALSPSDIEKAADAIRTADIVVCQLEIPLETVIAALRIAKDANVPTILNPAPARTLPEEIFRLISVITPNETEAALITGNTSEQPEESARQLIRQGVGTVVVTLGPKGVLTATFDGLRPIDGRRVDHVVDTTAAGDCFTGALSVALAEGKPLVDAVRFANVAASISVTRAGAQPSLPTREEVDLLL